VKDLEKDSSIVVTGFVDDIREYYKAADLCIIPLRIARGIQNKVLEAMSMGKPVITTTKAFDGIHGNSDKHAIVKDKPEQLAEMIIQLLNDKGRRDSLGLNARKFVIGNYNWCKNMNKLIELCADRSS
jgi:glycosyltransferase involved in cell wall biosynthesis